MDDWNDLHDRMTTCIYGMTWMARMTGMIKMNRMTWFTVITGVTGMIVMKRKSRITSVTRMNGVMR